MATNYEKYLSSPELCVSSFIRANSCPIAFVEVRSCNARNCKHYDECNGTTPYSKFREWFTEWLQEECDE